MSDDGAKVCVVITCYKPPYDLWRRCNQLRESVREVIVVDNTPGGCVVVDREFQGIVLSDGINKGLGAALNLGVKAALQHGCEWVAFFDQDSTVPQCYVPKIMQEYQAAALASDKNLGAIAPTFEDDQTNEIHNSIVQRISGRKRRFVQASGLATSGLLVPVWVFQRVGAFTEEYFLDLVDFEWCWRARRSGFGLVRTSAIVLKHRLGLGEKSFLGLKYHIPADYRHYFQFRDGLNAIVGPVAPVYDRFRLAVLIVVKLVIYPFLLDRGFSRLYWMLLGFRDFALQKKGVGAAMSKLGVGR